MSVLTEQRLTKFQELPVICNAISSTMTFVNYRNLTNEILVRGSQRRLYLFRESFKSFYRSGSTIGPPECFRNCKSITLTFPGYVTMHFTGHRRWFPLFQRQISINSIIANVRNVSKTKGDYYYIIAQMCEGEKKKGTTHGEWRVTRTFFIDLKCWPLLLFHLFPFSIGKQTVKNRARQCCRAR